MANLLLTMLQQAGLQRESFGISSGTLSSLRA